MDEKNCEHCGVPFTGQRESSRFCSRTCSRRSRCVTLAERFWSKVDKRGADECWEWNARRNACGYGTFQLKAKQSALAHRVCWTITSGDIPEGMSVCHRCDNPAHLFLGTHLDNMRDMFAKGRREAVRGEQHHLARLCPCAVRMARRLAAEGVMQKDIARRLDVSKNCVRGVVRGETWRHVA